MDWLEIKEFFKDAFKYIILVIVVLVVAIYIVGLQQVVGPSMSPNLKSNDVLILDKISYKFSDIKRCEIVSLYYADTKYLIKRVIGLPGEYIEYKNNTLYIDGNMFKEEYLGNDIITDDFSIKDLGYDKIPEDMYLVLGDNRQDSLDSRDPNVGLIKRNNIIGKVRARIWPLNKMKLIR